MRYVVGTCHDVPVRAFTEADRRVMADPTFAARYRAASAHDDRLDGYFVVGRPMSEIFCRPGCASRTPRPSRVAFYPTGAAAHAAGLVPCPRCRPDAAAAHPGLAAGDGLAARAIRLIRDGEIERTGVDGVARRIGVTTRHLRRVVEARTGCGPLALARTRRAHLAHLLLTSTAAPLSQVAAASGFTGIRQFTATVSRFYGLTPGALRAGSRPHAAPPASPDGPLVLRCTLPLREPYDAAGVLDMLAERAIPGVETCGDGWYARTVRLPHDAGHVRVDVDGRRRMLAALAVADPRDLIPLLARLRGLLDLDADPVAVDATLCRDRVLAPAVAARPGIRVPGAVDIEETLLCTVLAQAFAPAAARAALGRVTQAIGEATPWGMLFPTAQRIAARGRGVLPGPRRRVDTVLRMARDIAAGRLVLHRGHTHARLVEMLRAYPGVGPRTAGIVALRVLGSPDVLSVDGADIRRGARVLGLPSDAATLAHRGALWAPWRSYAGMHLHHAAGAA